MAEIGAQLREARTRARIEIAQMEAQTKIRAKYLRALENEEWELLPGPTYVKSFLRTYGDMLGIDGRQLVTDYKNTHEPFQAEGDIGQLSKHTGGRMNRQPSGPGLGSILAVLVLVIALAGGGYYLLGRDSGDGATAGAGTPTPEAVTEDGEPVATREASSGSGDRPTARKNVSVVVEATSDGVLVCVRAGKRIAVPETQLRAGQKTEAVRGKSVTVTAGVRNVRVTVSGRRVALPAGSSPITVTITEAGVKRAAESVTACRA